MLAFSLYYLDPLSEEMIKLDADLENLSWIKKSELTKENYLESTVQIH